MKNNSLKSLLVLLCAGRHPYRFKVHALNNHRMECILLKK